MDIDDSTVRVEVFEYFVNMSTVKGPMGVDYDAYMYLEYESVDIKVCYQKTITQSNND